MSAPTTKNNNRPMPATPLALVAAVMLVLLPAACSRDAPAPAPGGGPGTSRAGASGPPAMPPVEVAVVTAAPSTVGLLTELPGRTEAARVAQVRARAAGIVQRVLFREGSEVRAGQPLFAIDDAPYRATLASAQATLARAEANLMQARAQAERYKPLLDANAISQQEYVAAQASFKQAEADVAAGKAAVRSAEINLGYASVVSPISGRIGRALVTEGALVGQGEATPLAVVQQIDPLYVNFTQPAAEVLKLRAAMREGRVRRAGGPESAAVRVVLEDGSVYPRAGRLLFSELTVDAGTGQIQLRAELPNPERALLPGLYVRVQLEQAEVAGAIVLPQQAVQTTGQGYTVLVVGTDGKVAPRPVKLGPAQGGRWVVNQGLQPGEQVVVEGFQKIRPNAVVRAVPWQPPGARDATPGAPAASGAPAGPAASAARAPLSAPAPAAPAAPASR